MSDAVIVALIASIPPTLVSLASLVASLRNGGKLDRVEKTTNGMTTRLEEASHAKGKLEGYKDRESQERGKDQAHPKDCANFKPKHH